MAKLANIAPKAALLFTYTLDQHGVRNDQIDTDALWIIQKLHQAGFPTYVVGGGVRDLIMGKKPKDFDIATAARPGQVRRYLRNCLLIGRRFRLAHVRFGSKIIEVATFRSGENDGDLIVRDNQWGTAQDDVQRRDFTVNGLFYDPFEQTILDYVGGYSDLLARTLKTIGDPTQRFHQDPVRMLRLLKFRARFDLTIDEKTYSALLSCKDALRMSSPARVLEELLRMLESGYSKPFFTELVSTELLKTILPDLHHHLTSPKGASVMQFLDKIDRYHLGSRGKILSRQTLVCCLLFPILEMQIDEVLRSAPKTLLNASLIADSIRNLMGQTLGTLTLFPRKLFAQIAHILQQQFRLDILYKRKSRPHRMLLQSEFPLSLEFLAIRSLVKPQLRQQLMSWKESFDEVMSPKSPQSPPKSKSNL